MDARFRWFAVLAAAGALGFAALAQDSKPTGRPVGATMVKPVVCNLVEKAGTSQDLAAAIEQLGARYSRSNYALVAVVPGDPPVACFQSRTDFTKLPIGAR